MNESTDHAGSTVPVWIYKGTKRADTYVFIGRPDDFEALPADLRLALGNLELVMQIDLYEGRKLARANAAAVMAGIEERGFYLQMPPVDRPGEGRVH